MNKTIDQIASELVPIYDALALSDGEMNEALEKELAEVESLLPTKADGYGFRIESMQSRVEFWESREKVAKQVKKAIQNHIDRMKEAFKATLIKLDKKEISGEEYSFKLRQSSQPKVLLTVEPQDLPAPYVVIQTEYKADLKKICEELKSGSEINGASLAYGQTLTITPKR
jgi:hypothetical protein